MSDPRLTPANGRVAARELEGRVDAARFVDGEPARIVVPVADLFCAGDGSGQLDRQLLFGDSFRVLERRGGRAFGLSDRGGYVGYVAEDALGAWYEPTHRVAARSTLGFAAPDIKHPAPLRLSLGARVKVVEEIDSFVRTQDNLFIPRAHLVAGDEPDTIAVAERLIGAPYLWGGNSADGIDCSGLVQAALLACGIPCPGDSDQQRESFPAVRRPRRGDLIFWQGHVAMCVTSRTVIHANAHHMAVTVEPRAACVARIKASENKTILKIARPAKELQ